MSDYREDVAALVHRLLPSQQEFIFSPEKEKIIASGWRGGKTRGACLAGTLLSYYIPDNLGFIGRAAGKDLKETTLQTFEEVCPKSLIIDSKGFGQQGREYIIRSTDPRRSSRIVCDYIIEQQTGRSHIAGMNLGWFLVDQVEEIEYQDWTTLLGRLSRKQATKKFALATMNQRGHNWVFREFYAKGDYKFDIKREPNVFYKVIRGKNRLGIVTRPEENKVSNGGFVEDDYFDTLWQTLPPSLQERLLNGSFDDFSGKICADYTLSSVHNVEPFPIPDHWPWVVGLDPGGSCEWGVGVYRIDEQGNKILVNDAPAIYKRNLNPNVVIRWLRDNIPTEKARWIIDYENIPFKIQLQDDLGIFCENAMKDIQAGVSKMMTDFHVNPSRELPDWYVSTQPRDRVQQFQGKGSPAVFAFNTCQLWAQQHDNYVWDEEKLNKPREDEETHYCDVSRYVCNARGSTATAPKVDKYKQMRKDDPISAESNDFLDEYWKNRAFERDRKYDTAPELDAVDEPVFVGDVDESQEWDA